VVRMANAVRGIVIAHGSPVAPWKPSKSVCTADMLASRNRGRGDAWKERQLAGSWRRLNWFLRRGPRLARTSGNMSFMPTCPLPPIHGIFEVF